MTKIVTHTKKNENLTAHQHIFLTVISVLIKDFSTFLSKITKYNRVPLGFEPSVARLLSQDPTPRPTCLASFQANQEDIPNTNGLQKRWSEMVRKKNML